MQDYVKLWMDNEPRCSAFPASYDNNLLLGLSNESKMPGYRKGSIFCKTREGNYGSNKRGFAQKLAWKPDIFGKRNIDGQLQDLRAEGGRGAAAGAGDAPLPRRGRRARLRPLVAAPLRGGVQLERGPPQPVLLAPAAHDALHYSAWVRSNNLQSDPLHHEVPEEALKSEIFYYCCK